MKKAYIQYGCGLSAPAGWRNFDASPTLRIQKLPFLGILLQNQLNTVFPKNVEYGDIVKGLPVQKLSGDAVFCSHTLEHLALEDCRIALKNTFDILKPGGIFRLIVPDIESYTREYLSSLEKGNTNAAIDFISKTMLGLEKRKRGIKSIVTAFWGNSHHLWMWDTASLKQELLTAGFSSVRRCYFGDCPEPMMIKAENEARYTDSIGLEAIK